MYIESKTFLVKQGFGEQLLKKFSGNGPISQAEGFVELNVLRNIKKGDTEEIIVLTKWESQAAYTNWKKSDTHKAGHQSSTQKRPEHILDVKMGVYAVEVSRTPDAPTA